MTRARKPKAPKSMRATDAARTLLAVRAIMGGEAGFVFALHGTTLRTVIRTPLDPDVAASALSKAIAELASAVAK